MTDPRAPQYGYPPVVRYEYGPPGPVPFGYGAPAVPPAPPPRPALRFGVVAAGLAAAGSVLVLLALAGLDWYSFQGGQGAGDVRHLLAASGPAANGLAVAYYSWLGWLLVVLCAGAAVLAALPRRALSLAFRIAGPILAALAALFTVGSVELTSAGLAESDALQAFYFGHLAAGFWTALCGFVLIGAGALVGPMRRKPD